MLMLARVMVLVAGLLLVVGLVVPGAALAGEGCPNELLRAENNSLGLPDCRAFEMVTPTEKNSAHVYPNGNGTGPTVAADGSSLVGESPEGFAGIENNEERGTEKAVYRFSRGGSGWVTTPLQPYRGLIESVGVGDSVWSPTEQVSVERLRVRAADGVVSEIGPVWPPALGPSDDPGVVLGAAAEAVNGVVFTIRQIPGLLWPFDSTIPGPRQGEDVLLTGSPLYEYTGTGNTAPSLVGVSGGVGSTELIGQCGTELGGNDHEDGLRNAVSEGGGTVFFTAQGADHFACGGVQPPVNELFARIDGSSTVAISEPSAADCLSCDTSAPEDGVFQGASADGSRVFFTTTQPLLGHDTSENLYEYDFDPPAGQPKVVRVSAGDGSVSEPAAEVQSVANVSEDGSHIYFVAKGVLTTAANSLGEHAQPGGENFYVWERDAEYPEGRTVFIAGCGDVGANQVTPDGRFLAFTSSCHLTTGDTSASRQVFQYDAQTGSMVRVSVGLEGYDDDGNVTQAGLDARIEQQPVGGDLAARGGAIARTMSDDGAYVFFQSPVALTPRATGGGVYEYHAGRVWLISSQTGLVGVSASGGDVFFSTTERLVPQDTDTQVDFYDARVGGGFPAPVTPVGCVGEGCQGAPSPSPVFGVPSSVVLSGGGNLAPPPVSAPVLAPKKALTAAQELSRALKACVKDPRRKRASCEARARRRYGHTSRVVQSDRRSK
jgi:hypothetical protein